MHFQDAVPNWPQALVQHADGALVKSVSNPSLLTVARQNWAGAGRDQSRLVTIYRHFDYVYPFDRPYSFAEHQAIWRANFFRWLDATNLPHVVDITAVETLNEHTDTRMVTNKALLAPHLLTEQAAVSVWNNEFRGRTVHSPDGGEGAIPADCRLVIVNGPEGNDIPVEFFQLAIESDSILGYHPYSFWLNNQRQPGDWEFTSGRWNTNEIAYGLRPLWAFTECGPFKDAGNGWRAKGVCDGRVDLLVDAHRQVTRDVHTTLAFAQGRIVGWPGAWYTSNDNPNESYLLRTPELTALANMYRLEFPPEPPRETNMDAQTLAKLKGQAQSIIDTANAMIAELATITPTPAKHVPGPLNQVVINLFSKAAGAAYIDWLTRAGLTNLYDPAADRKQPYTGPAIEDLPGLTDAEKAALIATLAGG